MIKTKTETLFKLNRDQYENREKERKQKLVLQVNIYSHVDVVL